MKTVKPSFYLGMGFQQVGFENSRPSLGVGPQYSVVREAEKTKIYQTS